MRRVLVTIVLGVVAVAAGACGSDSSPPPDRAAPPPSSSPGAAVDGSAHTATLAVCAEAVKVSKAGATAFSGTLDELWLLAQADLDRATIEARSAQREKALRTVLDNWSKTLSALATQDVIPQVKAVLEDGARTVDRLNDPADLTSDGEATVTLRRISRKIEAACTN
ncbi:hypothetical protein [Asanoa sp. NPDC050611]|uniref:hypothetical protein n=1 Tax=Asanoa sp. NPDC050611 TaxID=3157098 RepID=UPI0033FD3C7E